MNSYFWDVVVRDVLERKDYGWHDYGLDWETNWSWMNYYTR